MLINCVNAARRTFFIEIIPFVNIIFAQFLAEIPKDDPNFTAKLYLRDINPIKVYMNI
ncbi:MAG: hypothetical protein ACTSUL_04980 [Promethearchaeota archaeon]